jgi:hypothetical protein
MSKTCNSPLRPRPNGPGYRFTVPGYRLSVIGYRFPAPYIFFNSDTSAVSTFLASPNSILLLSL